MFVLRTLMVSTLPLLTLGVPGCKSPEMMASPDRRPPSGEERREPSREVLGLMRAAIDMQHNGEPLAEAMGRNLAGFDRNALRPDQ